MKTKTTSINYILMLLLLSFVFYNCTNNIQAVKNKSSLISFDTLFLGKHNFTLFPKSDKILKNDSTIFLKRRIGKASGYWLDSILYLNNNTDYLTIISGSADQFNYNLFYYNRDSLYTEVIAKNAPRINVIKLKTGKEVVLTEDTINSFGDQTKCVFLLEYNSSGKLIRKNKFLSTKGELSNEFDYRINILPSENSIIVKSNDSVLFIVK